MSPDLYGRGEKRGVSCHVLPGKKGRPMSDSECSE